jgi:hypothetical protein
MPANPFLVADSTHVIRGGPNEALQTRKLRSLVKPQGKFYLKEEFQSVDSSFSLS